MTQATSAEAPIRSPPQKRKKLLLHDHFCLKKNKQTKNANPPFEITAHFLPIQANLRLRLGVCFHIFWLINWLYIVCIALNQIGLYITSSVFTMPRSNCLWWLSVARFIWYNLCWRGPVTLSQDDASFKVNFDFGHSCLSSLSQCGLIMA